MGLTGDVASVRFRIGIKKASSSFFLQLDVCIVVLQFCYLICHPSTFYSSSSLCILPWCVSSCLTVIGADLYLKDIDGNIPPKGFSLFTAVVLLFFLTTKYDLNMLCVRKIFKSCYYLEHILVFSTVPSNCFLFHLPPLPKGVLNK